MSVFQVRFTILYVNKNWQIDVGRQSEALFFCHRDNYNSDVFCVALGTCARSNRGEVIEPSDADREPAPLASVCPSAWADWNLQTSTPCTGKLHNFRGK